jgi:hypothetical protein
MSESPVGDTSPTDAQHVPLVPRERRQAAGSGCLTRLAMPTTAAGAWLIADALIMRPGPATPFWEIPLGIALVLAGLWLIVYRIRRIIAPEAAPIELAFDAGIRLAPGATAALEVQLRGPARLARVAINLVCERRRSPQSAGPVWPPVPAGGEVEVVHGETLLEDTDLTIARGDVLSRPVKVAIPSIAIPSGPTPPDGVIAWHLDVASTAPDGTVAHDLFDINIAASESDATAIQPPGGGLAPDAQPFKGLSEDAGCLVISLGFTLVGPFFLFLYFGGATTTRGNPVMGLIAGVVFTGFGLFGLWTLVSGRRKRRKG